MKIKSPQKHFALLTAALALHVSPFTTGHSQAQESAAPKEGISKHYEAVAKHLELGGAFYGFMDMDSDASELGEIIDAGLDSLRSSGAEIPMSISAKGIMKHLGLDSVKAIGMSSRKVGSIYHNRAFISAPDGPGGLLKMLGGKAAPFLSSKLAPSGTDLVMEEDFSVKALLDVVKAITADLDMPELEESLSEALDQPMGPLSMTVGEFIEKLETKLTVIAAIDGEKKLKAGPEEMEIPFIDVVISLDNMAWLYPQLKELLLEQEAFELTEGADFDVLKSKQPLPPGFEAYSPVLHFDKKSGRLYAAGRGEYLEKCLSGKSSITADEEYKKAMTGLPAEGNGLSYVSTRAIKQIWEILQKVAEEAPAEEAGMMLKMWEMMLPKEEVGMGTVRANLKDGMLFASNSVDSHKSTILTAAVYPMAMVGAFAAPVMMARGMGRGGFDQLELDQAEEFDPDNRPGVPGQKAPPEKKIQDNLQQIAFAAEAYFLDNPKEKEVGYGDLVKKEFLFELDPVAGENYAPLNVKRTGGKLSVKLKDGKDVEIEYPAVTD